MYVDLHVEYPLASFTYETWRAFTDTFLCGYLSEGENGSPGYAASNLCFPNPKRAELFLAVLLALHPECYNYSANLFTVANNGTGSKRFWQIELRPEELTVKPTTNQIVARLRRLAKPDSPNVPVTLLSVDYPHTTTSAHTIELDKVASGPGCRGWSFALDGALFKCSTVREAVEAMTRVRSTLPWATPHIVMGESRDGPWYTLTPRDAP
jgi:hypothetical protein